MRELNPSLGSIKKTRNCSIGLFSGDVFSKNIKADCVCWTLSIKNLKMSARTVEIIDGEIQGIKVANPNWMQDRDIIALITALTNEKNALAGT